MRIRRRKMSEPWLLKIDGSVAFCGRRRRVGSGVLSRKINPRGAPPDADAPLNLNLSESRIFCNDVLPVAFTSFSSFCQ